MDPERVRVHQPPDFIINGKPKWTDIQMTEMPGQSDCSEETHLVDRLNPSRNVISSIESEYGEKAENTQKMMTNMMCDLGCELVVTLGDAKLSEKQEKKLLKEHQDWEEFKMKYDWKPPVKVKEKKKKPVRKVKVAKRKTVVSK